MLRKLLVKFMKLLVQLIQVLLQWCDYILWGGICSAHLWDPVSMLACYLSNVVVDWDDTHALMVNDLISLEEPDVQSIGIREALHSL